MGGRLTIVVFMTMSQPALFFVILFFWFPVISILAVDTWYPVDYLTMGTHRRKKA